jgi:hypothetical protein
MSNGSFQEMKERANGLFTTIDGLITIAQDDEEISEDKTIDQTTQIPGSSKIDEGQEAEFDPFAEMRVQFDIVQADLEILKGLQTDIAILKHNDNLLKADILGVETNFKTVDARHEFLTAQINGLESKISYLQSNMGLTGNSAADRSFANPPPSSIVGE